MHTDLGIFFLFIDHNDKMTKKPKEKHFWSALTATLTFRPLLYSLNLPSGRIFTSVLSRPWHMFK